MFPQPSIFCIQRATKIATANGHVHLKREGRDVKEGTVEAITFLGWHVSVAGSFWLVCREPHRGRHCQKRFSPAPRKCVNCMVRNILSRTQKWFSSNHRPVSQSPILSASSHWRKRRRLRKQGNSSKCVDVPKSQFYRKNTFTRSIVCVRTKRNEHFKAPSVKKTTGAAKELLSSEMNLSSRRWFLSEGLCYSTTLDVRSIVI